MPEYLKLRFDEKTRALNAVTFAIMTVFSSGISMYALGLLFELVLHWSFTASVLLSAAIVLVYTFLGGLTSAIYNEVLQFFLIVLGFAPLSIFVVMKTGGWSGMAARLPQVMTHTWKYAGSASQNPMGVEVFGLVAGLGFVLSFGYWCTDFLVVQRAMAADSMSAARRTPLIAAFPKMVMPFVVIIPGIAALALSHMALGYSIPLKPDGVPDYDQTLTTLMAQFYPSGMLGLGLTALMASFMSGMAGNVTAFNTVWTYDLYQGHIRKNAPDSHYLWVGRVTTVVGVALSIATAYLASALQQHHGFSATGVWLCECAAVRDIFAGNVLEARHRPRRVCRIAGGNWSCGAYAWVDAGRRKGRMARKCAPHVSVHHGAEFLDRDFRLVHLLSGYLDREPDVGAQGRSGASQSGLWPYQDPARRSPLVQAATPVGGDRHCGVGYIESAVLVI